MNLLDVSGDWKICPQKPCKETGKELTARVRIWAGMWDGMVWHVTSGIALGPAGDNNPKFLSKWAAEVIAYGEQPAREVLANLERIRKGADITPEMVERWNNALLPFIQASESALRKALGIAP